ncbi:histidine--tRNA ligase [soil metagenome]
MTDSRREQFQTLRGMRDVLAPESARRRSLLSAFASQCELAGYHEVVPPLVEDLGVFLRVGESTDVVTKDMYDFTDKDGSRIALRPEMTAGVMRAFVQHRPILPWKVWYAGTNFRHERPQKGRYRMFDQLGSEALGGDDPDLDVEVIALASRFFESIGLRRVRLLINSLGEQEDRARYTEAVRVYLESRLRELSEASQVTLTRNPLRVLDSKRAEDAAIIADAPLVAEFLSDESATHYARVLAGLDALGIAYEEDPRLVRGLDYYRRTTFEFAADALDSAPNAVGGGGRYDGLAEAMGGPATDGIGFALGVDRILLACDAEEVFPASESAVDTFVIDLVGGDAARDLTHELRSAGVSSDRRFGGGSMKAQMKSADRSHARFAIIVGEDELADGEVTLRPMTGIAADGEQRRVSRDDLLAELERSLA